MELFVVINQQRIIAPHYNPPQSFSVFKFNVLVLQLPTLLFWVTALIKHVFNTAGGYFQCC